MGGCQPLIVKKGHGKAYVTHKFSPPKAPMGLPRPIGGAGVSFSEIPQKRSIRGRLSKFLVKYSSIGCGGLQPSEFASHTVSHRIDPLRSVTHTWA